MSTELLERPEFKISVAIEDETTGEVVMHEQTFYSIENMEMHIPMMVRSMDSYEEKQKDLSNEGII